MSARLAEGLRQADSPPTSADLLSAFPRHAPPPPDNDGVVCPWNVDLQEGVKPLSARHERVFVVVLKQIFRTAPELRDQWGESVGVIRRETAVPAFPAVPALPGPVLLVFWKLY